MNTPEQLAELVMKHGPQNCVKIHRNAAIGNMAQIRYQIELEVLNAMASLAYRYGRKKSKLTTKKKPVTLAV